MYRRWSNKDVSKTKNYSPKGRFVRDARSAICSQKCQTHDFNHENNLINFKAKLFAKHRKFYLFDMLFINERVITFSSIIFSKLHFSRNYDKLQKNYPCLEINKQMQYKHNRYQNIITNHADQCFNGKHLRTDIFSYQSSKLHNASWT